jgi:solute carrier family 13 (sodium-dependent dicarboxylate transporter), member 2/3/5
MKRSRKIIVTEKEKLGKMSREQKASLIILLLVLILMFAAPYWAGDDSYPETGVIAIFGGVSLFVIPKNRTEKFLNWSGVQKVPLRKSRKPQSRTSRTRKTIFPVDSRFADE